MLRGDKTIPYNSIVAVLLAKGGFLHAGYLQLTLKGGSGIDQGLFQAVNDRNTICLIIRKTMILKKQNA